MITLIFLLKVVVTTPKNLNSQMENEKLNFIPGSSPQIVVKSLTEENIKSGLENFSCNMLIG